MIEAGSVVEPAFFDGVAKSPPYVVVALFQDLDIQHRMPSPLKNHYA